MLRARRQQSSRCIPTRRGDRYSYGVCIIENMMFPSFMEDVIIAEQRLLLDQDSSTKRRDFKIELVIQSGV